MGEMMAPSVAPGAVNLPPDECLWVLFYNIQMDQQHWVKYPKAFVEAYRSKATIGTVRVDPDHPDTPPQEKWATGYDIDTKDRS